MAETVSYPSELFPAPPTVSLTVPDAWSALPLPEVVVAVATEHAADEFRPTVVVAVSRNPTDFTLEVALAAIAEKLIGLTEREEVVNVPTEIAGFAAQRVEVTFSDPRVGTIAQAVTFVLVPNGPVVDLVQITGSCSAGQIEATFGEIRGILSSAIVAKP